MVAAGAKSSGKLACDRWGQVCVRMDSAEFNQTSEVLAMLYRLTRHARPSLGFCSLLRCLVQACTLSLAYTCRWINALDAPLYDKRWDACL